MTTFFLILMLLDSAQFGFTARPRLRNVQSTKSQVVATAANTEEPEAVYYPIDQSDKFWPCPVDAKKQKLHCPEGGAR